MQIFCPSNHLMLNAERCPVCGWERPASGEIGKPLWQPVDLKAGLGGAGTSVFATGAVLDQTIAFPLRNGEVVGVSLDSGNVLWRNVLGEGLSTYQLVAEGGRFLAAVSDNRSLMESGNGGLFSIDPQSGEIAQIWEANTHHLSGPVLAGERILLRTSQPELVALRGRESVTLGWRKKLSSWVAIQPLVVDDLVVVVDGRLMTGESKIMGLSLEDGKTRWEISTPKPVNNEPIAASGKLFYCIGHRELAAFDLKTHKTAWSCGLSKIYCPPQVYQDLVLIVVRGDRDPNSPDHYQLQALNAADGKLVWAASLPDRVRIRPMLLGNQLFLVGDKGKIFAFDVHSGKLAWEYLLDEEDPIRTNLLLSDGKLVVGTYFGKLAALQVLKSEEKLEAPQYYQGQGNLELAAAAYALQGNYQSAAQIYEAELEDYPKALALYEYGQLYQQAGDLARKKEHFNQAKIYYEKSGDLDAQIEMMLEMGDELGAARTLEEMNRLEEAARCYEQAGEYRKAMGLFNKANLRDEGRRLKRAKGLRYKVSDAEQFEDNGEILKAAEAYLEARSLDKAVKLFQQCGEEHKEFAALKILIDTAPETWTLERMSNLARKLGNFKQEALARQQLDRPELTADAFERAAQQAEIIQPDNEAEIAYLFGRAAYFFTEAGLGQKVQPCKQKVLQYRKLAQVIVQGRTEKALREGEFNKIVLSIRNVGFGVAKDVEIIIDQERFEVNQSSGVQEKNLAAGSEWIRPYFIQPRESQVGDAVPLKIEWTWCDRRKTIQKDWACAPVRVQRKMDSQTDAKPQVIHAQNYIQGTYIGGDNMQSGSQKGDRVEVHRGEKPQIKIDAQDESAANEVEKQEIFYCPHCHMPIEEGAKFCDQCGNKLEPTE